MEQFLASLMLDITRQPFDMDSTLMSGLRKGMF